MKDVGVWAGKAKGFTVTPFQAGHLLGGALWRINTPQQEQLVYAMDLNQRRERHLGGCMLEMAANRPLLLISDARSVDRPPVDVSKRDRSFLDTILQTLRGDGATRSKSGKSMVSSFWWGWAGLLLMCCKLWSRCCLRCCFCSYCWRGWCLVWISVFLVPLLWLGWLLMKEYHCRCCGGPACW